MSYISKNLFIIAVLSIIVVSVCLRFINYENRWGLAYDQAHDAIVARYAVFDHAFPLLGPFSSAGPFQTGGEWYWFIMLGTVFLPFTILSPWLFMTTIYVLFVLLVVVISTKLFSREFALIAGGLAAVSTAQITQGTNLTNQSPQAVLSLLSIWMAVGYMRTKQPFYAFLLALSISTAASIHLQGAAVITLLLFTLLFSGIPKVKTILFVILGVLLPWTPVLLVDIQNDFFNTRNMIQYYTHDQYAISLDVLGRRWLTYAGEFWPKMWGFVIGGNTIAGYSISIFVVLTVLYSFWKKLLPKEWIVLLISFLCMVIILRYTRTPLFESYIVFLHPFIILFTAWSIYMLFIHQRWVSLLFFALVIGTTLVRDMHEIRMSSNTTAPMVGAMRNMLMEKYPSKTFTIYDFQHKTKDKSYPFVLYLMEKNVAQENGMKIGLIATDAAQLQYPLLSKNDALIKMVNLDGLSTKVLEKEGWGKVTPEEVYISTEEWYKRK